MLKLADLRKRRHEEEDLWPISLADMMTLLLCFFLLVVAVSHIDIGRYERVADSMQKAMIPPPPKPKPQTDVVRSKVSHTVLARERVPEPELPKPQPQPQPKPEESDRTGPRRKTLDDLRKELAAKLTLHDNEVEVISRDNGVALNLRGAAFFDLASADIKPAGLPLLREIAATLAGTPYKVIVEGHTDNLPIESWLYPSNWELSSARASRVARLLIDQGVPKDHLRVEGLADTQPIAPNDDPSGRPIPENQAKNRRVVILVTP